MTERVPKEMPKVPTIPTELTKETWIAVTTRQGMTEHEQFRLWSMVEDIDGYTPRDVRKRKDKNQPIAPEIEWTANQFTVTLQEFEKTFRTPEQLKSHVEWTQKYIRALRRPGKSKPNKSAGELVAELSEESEAPLE
jgi:hypothetical protein